jgi:hypothetical protein
MTKQSVEVCHCLAVGPISFDRRTIVGRRRTSSAGGWSRFRRPIALAIHALTGRTPVPPPCPRERCGAPTLPRSAARGRKYCPPKHEGRAATFGPVLAALASALVQSIPSRAGYEKVSPLRGFMCVRERFRGFHPRLSSLGHFVAKTNTGDWSRSGVRSRWQYTRRPEGLLSPLAVPRWRIPLSPRDLTILSMHKKRSA